MIRILLQRQVGRHAQRAKGVEVGHRALQTFLGIQQHPFGFAAHQGTQVLPVTTGLRQEIAKTISENKSLSEKINGAKTRLEVLLDQIPENEE